MTNLNKKILEEFREKFYEPGTYLLKSGQTMMDVEVYLEASLDKVREETARDVIEEMQHIDVETWDWDRGTDTVVKDLKEKYGLSKLKKGKK